MTDPSFKKIELVLKSIVAGLTLLALVVGGFQYLDTTKKNFKKYFWEKQLDTYNRAVNIAAKLSIYRDDEISNGLYREFLTLYHGDMVIFEDQQVMQAMKSFIEIYIDYQEDMGLQWKVQESSRQLARTCRKSIAESWDIGLKELDFTKF